MKKKILIINIADSFLFLSSFMVLRLHYTIKHPENFENIRDSLCNHGE